jgi:hypothetical protein
MVSFFGQHSRNLNAFELFTAKRTRTRRGEREGLTRITKALFAGRRDGVDMVDVVDGDVRGNF